MAAIVISCIALVISIVAAGYAAREAIAIERRLRGETDAPRTTYFRIMIYNMDRSAEQSRDVEGAYSSVYVENIGSVEAKDVKLTVTAADSKDRWIAGTEFLGRQETLDVELGRTIGSRLYNVEVSWKDGRRIRQKYRRTMQSYT